jgi:hypothetical protein
VTFAGIRLIAVGTCAPCDPTYARQVPGWWLRLRGVQALIPDVCRSAHTSSPEHKAPPRCGRLRWSSRSPRSSPRKCLPRHSLNTSQTFLVHGAEAVPTRHGGWREPDHHMQPGPACLPAARSWSWRQSPPADARHHHLGPTTPSRSRSSAQPSTTRILTSGGHCA